MKFLLSDLFLKYKNVDDNMQHKEDKYIQLFPK